MKNIQLIDLDKHSNSKYEIAEDKIYKNTEEDIYVFAVNFDLEEEEDSQYPLEDVWINFTCTFLILLMKMLFTAQKISVLN
jgi:hypothetical protein